MQSSNHTCPADRPPAPPPRASSRLLPPSSASKLTAIGSLPDAGSGSNAVIDAIEVDDLSALMLDDDLLLGSGDDVDDDDDDDLLPTPPTKHFLDYDSQPPPGFEALLPPVVAPGILDEATAEEPDSASSVVFAGTPCLYPGEACRIDKKYETDGEISDFELATYSQTMRARRAEKALSAEDQQQMIGGGAAAKTPSPVPVAAFVRRKKHFLDENPIAPDDVEHCVSGIPVALQRDHEQREHRSLDRNYERAKELCFKPPSAKQHGDRKHSLTTNTDAGAMHASTSSVRRKETTTSFALARFLEHDPQHTAQRTTGTWPTDRSGGSDAQHHNRRSPYTPGTTPLTTSAGSPNQASRALSDMGPKVECVYSLLSMLGCNDQIIMSRKFLELSQSPETCAALRQSRCIPLIVQIIHSDEADEQTRKDASRALHNVVNCHPDDKAGRREAKVLRHIEHVMEYCESLKQMLCDGEALADDRDRHPLQAMSSLMKISFDEEHRHAMCQLGALQAIASIVQYDHAMHGSAAVGTTRPDDRCVALRRYAAMALTNLTFGDGNNKAALCANKEFMRAFVGQLTANADDLLPVTANVLRNLSWRADATMKQVLNEIGTVTALTRAVMNNQNESTIKALLSALWNLSAHCTNNKAEFCAVDGALGFLVDMLQYEGPSKTLTIIENAGGILRNVSSHVALSEPDRLILRQRNCLGILLAQLSSESLTIVSNACGTLWNMSAHCPEDQRYLIDNRAVPRLSLLVHSKHKMISNGSIAALKNLMNFRPGAVAHNGLDTVAKAMRLRELPTLTARKQRAFTEDLDQTLGETCENIEITTPPKETASSGGHSLGFVSARLTNSDTAAVSHSLVLRCESNGSLASSTESRLKPPASRSSPSTPQRSVRIRETVGAHDTAARTVTQQQRYQDGDYDQITDFSRRYTVDDKPQHSTGLESPEKCVQYAEEGTPVAFQSYQSLEEPPAAVDELDQVDEVITVETETIDLETPLMFSRHSSVGSLSSVELPDVPSTSDLSRLASGVISPSDIPDSPSQMMTENHGNLAMPSIQIGTKMHSTVTRLPLDDAFSSIDSVDSTEIGPNSNSTAILQQCIQMGMHKPSRLPAPMSNPTTASPKRSQLPLYKSSSVRHVPMSAQDTNNIGAVVSPGDLDRSMQSLNDFSQQLDRSNEYPAQAPGGSLMSASIATDATDISASMALCAAGGHNMEQSNEFMLDEQELHDESERERPSVETATASTISDKHKDPDLMLQSVDRLTQELVSQAEYLRSTASDSGDGRQTTIATAYERKSSNTNTWNEDTCPNEVSFPSISWTAPVICGDDDDTLSKSATKPAKTPVVIDTIPPPPAASQPESLDTDTATLVNDDYNEGHSIEQDLNNTTEPLLSLAPSCSTAHPTGDSDSGIRFHVGGPTFRDHHRLPAATSLGYQLGSGRHYTFDAGTAAMTKSTIIALEASKLAADLLNHMPASIGMSDSCSSLDLDDIRPPSGMDTCSAYFESQPNSMAFTVGQPSLVQAAAAQGGIAPMFSPQLARRKKSLPAGLMAKRALHHFAVGGGGGSLESVHSSCNLENVKPPSIMDELMDSMISVASITSEVASPDMSQYDTAVSQMLRHDDDPDRTEAPDAADDDDTTTLRSCIDMPCDANDDRTPLGSELSSAESTPVRKVRSVRRALTLKQKRQATKERYRTYTIAADMMLLDSADESGCENVDGEQGTHPRDEELIAVVTDGVDEKLDAGKQSFDADGMCRSFDQSQTVQIEIVEGKQRVTPRQRRQEDRVRFQTQTIESFHLDELQQYPAQPSHDASPRYPHIGDITTSSGSNSLDDDADMSSIRALTERFRHIQQNADAGHRAATTAVQSPATVIQRLEPIVATAFDSLELVEQSDGESEVDLAAGIDEQTYNVAAPIVVAAVVQPPVKPKIVKPNERAVASSESDQLSAGVESTAKAIRGKKKAAYVSPYRKSPSTTTPTTVSKPNAVANGASSPTTKRPGVAISKLIATKSGSSASKIVAKTHVLLNKSGIGTKLTAAGNRQAVSGLVRPGYSAAAPVVKAAPPAMPERQGTFVKDEPSEPLLAAAVPVVGSLSPVKTTKLPTKQLPSTTANGSPTKTGAFVSKLRNPLQRSASIGTAATAAATNKSPRASTAAMPGRSAPDQTAAAAAKRRSVAGNGGTGVFYRSPSTPTVPQRSNSNASLRSGSTTNTRTSPSQPPTRSNSNLSKPSGGGGVTSRIASIWKKTDSNKAAAPSVPPSSKGGSTKPPPAANAGTRLIRSSTFDNTPPDGCTAPSTVVAPLRRRPNGSAAPVVGETNDKKRLSRLVRHHYNMMAPIQRLS